MSDKQILEKAISKAIDAGWLTTLAGTFTTWGARKSEQTGELYVEVRFGETNVFIQKPIGNIIFNHDFAKALWGEEVTYDMTHVVQPDNSYKMNVKPAWQYHLQQMVIAEDPIKYLGDHI